MAKLLQMLKSLGEVAGDAEVALWVHVWMRTRVGNFVLRWMMSLGGCDGLDSQNRGI